MAPQFPIVSAPCWLSLVSWVGCGLVEIAVAIEELNDAGAPKHTLTSSGFLPGSILGLMRAKKRHLELTINFYKMAWLRALLNNNQRTRARAIKHQMI
jgi:hypothetical protein